MSFQLFKLMLALGVFSTAAGCALNTPQVATVKRLIPMFGLSSQESFAPFAWSFSMAGTQYRVYAQKVQGRRVTFVNDYGMEVVWDGDSLIIIEGMPGGFGPYRSGRELNAAGQEERWYAIGLLARSSRKMYPAAALATLRRSTGLASAVHGKYRWGFGDCGARR